MTKNKLDEIEFYGQNIVNYSFVTMYPFLEQFFAYKLIQNTF